MNTRVNGTRQELFHQFERRLVWIDGDSLTTEHAIDNSKQMNVLLCLQCISRIRTIKRGVLDNIAAWQFSPQSHPLRDNSLSFFSVV